MFVIIILSVNLICVIIVFCILFLPCFRKHFKSDESNCYNSISDFPGQPIFFSSFYFFVWMNRALSLYLTFKHAPLKKENKESKKKKEKKLLTFLSLIDI